jgi:hypothetical protein
MDMDAENYENFENQTVAWEEILYMVPVTTQGKRGTVRHADFYPGRVEVMNGSTFVNCRDTDPDRGQRFIR